MGSIDKTKQDSPTKNVSFSDTPNVYKFNTDDVT